MIHYIKGNLALLLPGRIVVENRGIGYEITVPENASFYLKSEGDPVTVYTAVLVREDDLSLVGFPEQETLELFRLLITVSGVGARAAMSILSAMPVHEVKRAIAFEDDKTLSRANGVGKKTAQRIVLELKDKLVRSLETAGDVSGSASGSVSPAAADAAAGNAAAPMPMAEALSALLALGYSRGEATAALTRIRETDLTAEEYIKKALKQLF